MPQTFTADIAAKTRAAMIVLLNQRLAEALDLKLAVKQAHWNVKGPSFIGLHLLFDEVYDRVNDHGDTIVTRARRVCTSTCDS